MTLDAALIAGLAAKYLSPADAATFARLARPAIALRHVPSASPARTHLGGDAVLEPDQEWPAWNSRSLSLLAVVDAAELRGLPCDIQLPKTGLLNLFYDVETQPWGYDPAHRGGWRILVANPERATGGPAPPDVTRFRHVPLAPAPILTMPTWEEDAMAAIDVSDLDALDDLSEAIHEAERSSDPRHQIGGWPWLQQGPIWKELQVASNGVYVGGPSGYDDARAPALLPGVDGWRLLAQIDSDDAAGWMWGDAGCLYYGTPDADIGRMDPERAWMVLQCG